MLSVITFTCHPSETQSQEAYWHICTLQEKKKKKKSEKVLKVVFLKLYNLYTYGIYSRGWNNNAVDVPDK